MHKPSILWPPPTDLESDTLRETIRFRLRQVLHDQDRLKSFLCSRGRAPDPKDKTITPEGSADVGRKMDPDASASLPAVVKGQDQKIILELGGGETLEVDSQIQLYVSNNLVSHPFISHCGAFLGGLPPLFIMAGDDEVLRDEIVYTWVFSPPFLLRRSPVFQSSPSSKSFQIPGLSCGQKTLPEDGGDRGKAPHPDDSPSPSLRWMCPHLTHPLPVHNSREILFPSGREFLSVRHRDAAQSWVHFTCGREQVGVTSAEYFRWINFHESAGGWRPVYREEGWGEWVGRGEGQGFFDVKECFQDRQGRRNRG